MMPYMTIGGSTGGGGVGPPGKAATIKIGSVTTGDHTSITNSGTSSAAVFDFVLQKGEDGLSAYDIWLSQGNTGTIQDFLDSLQGRDGEPGQSFDPADLERITFLEGNAALRPVVSPTPPESLLPGQIWRKPLGGIDTEDGFMYGTPRPLQLSGVHLGEEPPPDTGQLWRKPIAEINTMEE